MTRFLALTLIAAIGLVGTAAIDRATAHAAVGAAAPAAPPCHHPAATKANGCDTLCAGSAPEFAQDLAPPPVLVVSTVAVLALPEPLPLRRATVVRLRPPGPAPPDLPAYLRYGRLLI